MVRTLPPKTQNDLVKEKIFTPGFLQLTAALLLGIISMTSLLATLPLYLQTIGGDEASAGIANSIFILFAVLPRPLIGKYIDQLGRKHFLLAGMLVFSLSAFFYPFMESLNAIYLTRAAQGMGWGAFFVSCYALASDIIPVSRRTEALGYFSSAPPLGMALGPLIGETVLRYANFHYAFLASGLLAAAALVMTAFVKEAAWTKREDSKLELFSRHALLPSLNIFFIAITVGAVITYIPLMGEAREIINIGIFFTFYGIIVVALRPLGGRMADRYGYFSILLPSLLCLCASMVFLSISYNLYTLIFSAVLFGAGLSMTFPVLMSWCLDITPLQARGKALSTFTSAIDLGIGTGSLGLGFVLVRTNYTAIYLLSAAVVVLSLFLLLGQRKQLSRAKTLS